MEYGYKPLIGICKTCYLKCYRCEDINFKGVWRCQYYLQEAKDGRDNNTFQVAKPE